MHLRVRGLVLLRAHRPKVARGAVARLGLPRRDQQHALQLPPSLSAHAAAAAEVARMREEWLVALAPHRLLQARRALVYGMVNAGHCGYGCGLPAAAAATLRLRPAFGTAAQLHAGKSEEGRACAEHDHGAEGGGWAHGTFPPAGGRSGAGARSFGGGGNPWKTLSALPVTGSLVW